MSTSPSCGPTVLRTATSHFYSAHEHQHQRPAPSSSSSGQPSIRTITSTSTWSEFPVDEEYSADFSPESCTKRFCFRSHTAAPAQTPLLPPTPCVPVRPLDANKGYPLPTNCFTDIDWIAEYNSNSAYSAVLTPRDLPGAVPRTLPPSAVPTTTRDPANRHPPLPQRSRPSVANSLVQTDIDGDDSRFWYKSTTRFASPEDEWDYERLKRRIREYTSTEMCRESGVDAGPPSRHGLGRAAAVNETVRQAAVRRLKVVLAHLTGVGNADTTTTGSSGSSATDDMGLNGDQIDIARLRMAIEELSVSSSEWTRSGQQ
ncbi:hypothetical protein POJ06DRAFT_60320 [Lipomyces tetrasporus]|uniref:Uncharacterized protein n=1 Tax=Lipomyces tetrasporus TaxID=54092 RepID=A0AAD7QWX2_9ASCO|nr:uncharacterized protein POJ06DRAFT_60320 [Lipomyces tetrasporus]KAJ8102980.1 hypothetical protein POJ06DRAFT_60320 [Lipomyces tetrasporus]